MPKYLEILERKHRLSCYNSTPYFCHTLHFLSGNIQLVLWKPSFLCVPRAMPCHCQCSSIKEEPFHQIFLELNRTPSHVFFYKTSILLCITNSFALTAFYRRCLLHMKWVGMCLMWHLSASFTHDLMSFWILSMQFYFVQNL